MKTRKTYWLAFLAVIVVVLVSAYRIGASRALASKKHAALPVKSLVPRLTIVSSIQQHDVVSLSLRNDYDKTITAFSISSSGVITRNEMLGSENVMVPGSTTTGEYELAPPSQPEKGTTVLAAVFEDGTTDGDPKFVRQILDAREGKQAQLARILPIIEETSMIVMKLESRDKWQTIALKISELPDCDKQQSFEFCAALNDEKELALRKIKQLEQVQRDRGDEVVQAMMSHIKEQYENKKILLERSLKLLQ